MTHSARFHCPACEGSLRAELRRALMPPDAEELARAAIVEEQESWRKAGGIAGAPSLARAVLAALGGGR